MPNFRYYCMDDAGAIFFGDYLDTPDLLGAIAECRHIARQKYWDRVRRIEIWDNQKLLYQASDLGGNRHYCLTGHTVSPAGGSFNEELFSLLDEIRHLALTIADLAISKRLTAVAEELVEQLDADCRTHAISRLFGSDRGSSSR